MAVIGTVLTVLYIRTYTVSEVYKGKECTTYIVYSGNIENKLVLADPHSCQCIVGTCVLNKVPLSKY